MDNSEDQGKADLPKQNKLWINVPKPSGPTWPPKRENNAFVKPTVTTLLRHHNILLRQEEKERYRAQNYAQGTFSPIRDQEAWHLKDLEGQKQQQIEESKRFLKAKLAYHKAKAAAEQNATEKSAQAQHLRDKNKKLADLANSERAAELERRRIMAAEIQDIHAHSRQMVRNVQKLKHQSVLESRNHIQELQTEAKRRDYEEFITRREKIRQIQAEKQAARAAKGIFGSNSTGNFIGALGSPEAEIRQKLSKVAAEEALEERRQRVISIKNERGAKLSGVKERLERQLGQSGNVRAFKIPFKSLPSFSHPSRDVADEEVRQLVQQLENFQNISSGRRRKY